MPFNYKQSPDVEATLEKLNEICDCKHERGRIFRRLCDTCLDDALQELVAMTRERTAKLRKTRG